MVNSGSAPLFPIPYSLFLPIPYPLIPYTLIPLYPYTLIPLPLYPPNYSLLNPSTGFLEAALNVCRPMVITAINKTKTTGTAKSHQVSVIL